MTTKTLHIGLAILLFLCLLDMPYGYYQLVRTIATFTFIYFGLKAMKSGEDGIMILFFGLAILFQPLFKIALGRTLWNVVDVVVGVWLIWRVVGKTPKHDKKIDH